MASKGEGGHVLENKVNKGVKFKRKFNRKSGEVECETYKQKEIWTEKPEHGEGIIQSSQAKGQRDTGQRPGGCCAFL